MTVAPWSDPNHDIVGDLRDFAAQAVADYPAVVAASAEDERRILERAELEAAGRAYERRSYANQRFHCTCGRFVRGRTVRFVGYWGRLAWTCTHCGDCHE